MIKVGILRGGIGEDYFESLEKGGEIISYIQKNFPDKFQPIDILVDREGVWHYRGLPIIPADLKQKVDVVWHTGMGDEKKILEHLFIPHISEAGFGRAITNDRSMFERHMANAGIKMSKHIILPAYNFEFDGPLDRYSTKKAMQIFEKFSSPWLVKTFTPDISIGVKLAKTFPELAVAISEISESGQSILVEELISGKKASVHSLSDFRGEKIYSFPPIEHRNDEVFAPGNFSQSEKEEMLSLVRDIFSHMSAEHYMQSDFVINPNRGIILTNVSFVPNMKEDSHFVESLETVGTTHSHIFEHMINKALNN
ncbi:MAG: hypothetical protein NTZ44_02020 [Candidatus Nomurabacteria bacterium]|nr:hypothetical protein [Candidatus Nomurabacteria bacterium]